MKKFIVETYYTCTFKTVHTLDDLNEKELSKIDQRSDGDVEVIDVKLNNRKTKKIGDKKNEKTSSSKIKNSIPDSIADKLSSANKDEKFENSNNTSASSGTIYVDGIAGINPLNVFKISTLPRASRDCSSS